MNLAELYRTPQQRGGGVNLADAIHAMVPSHQALVSAERDRTQSAEEFEKEVELAEEELALEQQALDQQKAAQEEQAKQGRLAQVISAGGVTASAANLLGKDAIKTGTSKLAALMSGSSPATEAVAAEAAMTAGEMEAAAGVAEVLGSTAASEAATTVAPAALKTAAAQSLAQQGAVGAGTTGAGTMVAKAIPYVGFALQLYNILSMGLDHDIPNLGYSHLLDAAEGRDVYYEGQQVPVVDNKIVDPGSGREFDLSDADWLDQIRSGYANQQLSKAMEGQGLNRGSWGREEWELFGSPSIGSDSTSGLDKSSLDALATDTASRFMEKVKKTAPAGKFNWDNEPGFGGLH
jgi:hypothetical protein